MSTEKIMEQAQVFASAWSVVGGPFDDGEAMDVAAQEKDELRRMVAELVAERDALAARLAELEGKEPVGEIIHSDVLPGADGAYRHELLCDFRLGVQTELYARPVPAEMSPEFTDTARSALLWVLWHHQGGSSPVGQPIRYALGMGAHERLSDYQAQEAKTWAELTNSETRDFHRRPAEPVNARLLDVATGKIPHLYAGLCPDIDASSSSRDPECPACQVLIAAEVQQERNGINPQAKGD